MSAMMTTTTTTASPSTKLFAPASCPTPLLYSNVLSKHLGIPVYLKMEMFHPSGSFKHRGITHLIKHLLNQGKTSIICSSGGNAGFAAAVSSRLFSLPCHIIVPSSTPAMMREKIQSEGAKLTVHGASWQEADQYAKELISLDSSNSIGYVHPFDHEVIWEGHAQLVTEMKDAGLPKPGAVVVSVGGGGLYIGVVKGLQQCGWKDVCVVTSETEGAASFHKSVVSKSLVTLDSINTIATTLGAKRVAEQAFQSSQTHPTHTEVISDLEALQAVKHFLHDHRVLVEPACAASLALVYMKAEILKKFTSIVVVVCGGNGVSTQLIDEWSDRLDPSTVTVTTIQ